MSHFSNLITASIKILTAYFLQQMLNFSLDYVNLQDILLCIISALFLVLLHVHLQRIEYASFDVCREMIQHRPYNSKVDVYSFGIVLWELITGVLPFQNMTAVQAAFAVVNKGARPIIPSDCLPALGEIMTRCWDPNPDVRPPFTEIVKMLEDAQSEISTTVRKARFRCCMAQPMTMD